MLNVLFITADQWRADCLGAAGHPVVRTPNLDRIAAEGVRFARHYGQASPCAPARACLYTGLYQMTNRVVRNGSPLDARHLTLAQAVRALGYDPTLFGYTDTGVDPRTTSPADPWLKTYEGILPGMSVRAHLPEYPGPWLSWLKARGVDVPENWQHVYMPADGVPALRGKAPRYGVEETQTAFLVGEFERWVSEQREPWFCHLSFLMPHPPFVVPEPYCSMYDPADGPAFTRSSEEAEAAKHPYLRFVQDRQSKNRQVYGPPGPVTDGSEADAREIRATYWGMVSEVDAQIGRVRSILEARGEWDRTIVIVTSDHGEMLGDHHLWGKLGFYDQSYAIPLVIRDPRATASRGRVVEAFTEAVDVMPTILDLVGGPVPGHLDGLSLKPFLDGAEPAAWRTEAHWEYDFRDISGGKTQAALGLDLDDCGLAVIRDRRFKYVHFSGLPPLLFDLERDPAEHVDRSADPDYAQTRIAYAEKMLRWRARHLDRRLSGIELTAQGPVDGRAGGAATQP
ncbi:alkaline phosphatase family protein [Prosthecomicrobium sp. N25]|uniref:alkaline phosphatase family protein n=1 Tax=Prosthecomicrobium sp. N25 TaxID=3129254 RepID=UPI0030785186